MMATILGLAGTVLVFSVICGAINKVASLLLPSVPWMPLSEDMQNLFSFIVAIILTAVLVTTPWDTYFSIAGYLLKTVCSMLLWCLLLLAIITAVALFVPSAVEERYGKLTGMITYTVTIILSKVLRMPSTSFLEIACLLLFCFLLLGSIFLVVQKLVPSAMERYPGFTSVVVVGLMLLGTRMLLIVMSWSTPIQKPALTTILELPSASTAATLVFDDFQKARQMNIILTAIREMKVEQKRDMGKMLAAMAWMIKIPIFVAIILIAAVAWMINFLKENSDELINACVSKVMEFVKDSLGPRRSACYKPAFKLLVGSTRRIREAARKAFGFS